MNVCTHKTEVVLIKSSVSMWYMKWLTSCVCSDNHGSSPKSNSPRPAQLSGAHKWALQPCEFITHTQHTVHQTVPCKHLWVMWFGIYQEFCIISSVHILFWLRSECPNVNMTLFPLSPHHTHKWTHTSYIIPLRTTRTYCPIGNATLTPATSISSPDSHQSHPTRQALRQPDSGWGAPGSCH